MSSSTNFVGWDFTNIWGYSQLDGREKPHLRVFFDPSDTNLTTVSPDLVTVIPNVVELKAGEKRFVRYSPMGGLGYDITAVTVSDSNPDGYATLTTDLTGLITISAKTPYTTTERTYTITVEGKIKGYPQPAKTFELRLIPTPSNCDNGGGGGGGGGGGSSPSLVVESQSEPITSSSSGDVIGSLTFSADQGTGAQLPPTT